MESSAVEGLRYRRSSHHSPVRAATIAKALFFIALAVFFVILALMAGEAIF